MDKNNILTKFNEGGLHENNPNGGVMIGNNNSVEQDETKLGNFVYSNRIMLDANIVSQYNLPKSLIGKSVADATKMIDSKFKDRNDKISQSTKDSMLSKIAEAQEAMKPQEPEIERSQENMEQGYSQETTDNGQMSFGGFKDSIVGQGFSEDATSEQKSAALSAGLGTLTTGLDLGRTAFGKPTQDTSGLAASAPVNGGMMIAGNALKGASAGAAFGPLGAGIGAGVGAIAGLISSGKARKAAAENTNNFALNTNRRFADTYAMGGEINLVDPNKKLISNQSILPTTVDINDSFNTKKIVKYQPGVTNDKMGSGFYLYSKNPTEAGFDYKKDREFVKQSGMMDVQKTAQWQDYMTTQSLKPKQLANGGPITGYDANGKWIKPIVGEADYNTNTIQNLHDIIGIKPTDKGYGTAWGNKSNQALFNYEINQKNQITLDYQKKGINQYSNTKKEMLNGSFPKTLKNLGLTPEGYKFNPQEIVLPEKVEKKSLTLADLEKANPLKKVSAENINTKPSIWQMLGNAARYAPIAMNAYQLSKLKKPESEILDRLNNKYKPEYADEKSLQNIADNAMNNSVNAISQSGASQGQIRASLIGSQLQRTKGLSNAYMSASSQNRATNDRAQTFNLGVDQVNLNQSNTEKDINARDQAAYRNEKSKYLSEIGNNIGDVGKEEVYKKIIAKSTGYKWDGKYVKDADGTVVKDPDTNKPMTKEKLKEMQSTKNSKKALGGYLIKNKTK